MNRDEELARLRRTVLTREAARAEADVLFGGVARQVRKDENEKLRRLFVQAPAAETRTNGVLGTEKLSSVAPNVDAFFEKVAQAMDPRTEAQRRFPELLKVASPRAGTFMTPSLPPRKPAAPGMGEVPTKSPVSGGSA
jgi:hypothetical protein